MNAWVSLAVRYDLELTCARDSLEGAGVFVNVQRARLEADGGSRPDSHAGSLSITGTLSLLFATAAAVGGHAERRERAPRGRVARK